MIKKLSINETEVSRLEDTREKINEIITALEKLEDEFKQCRRTAP